MREWIRSHLTYANVMATLAVFLVLSGGTAVALNGSNTVQSDDIGPGAQVKAPDVAANAVNGANIVDNSVTGGDVNESTLNGLVRGRMVDLNMFVGGPPKTVKVGPYTIRERCSFPLDRTLVNIDVAGPAGSAEAEWSEVQDDTSDQGNFSVGHAVPATGYIQVVQIGEVANFARGGGTLVVRSNSGVMVQLDFSAVTDNHLEACHVWGTATTGT